MDSYIILSAATSFAAFIGCLIGYHIRERRHGAAMVELQRLHEEGCVRMVRRHEEQFSRQVTASNNTLNLLAERVDCANADAETLKGMREVGDQLAGKILMLGVSGGSNDDRMLSATEAQRIKNMLELCDILNGKKKTS